MPGRKKKIGVPRGVSDDSFRIAKSDNKIKLFGKFNNKWYAVPMQDAFEVTNDFEAVEDGIITYNRKNKGRIAPNILASHDGILTLRKKGTGKAASTDIQLYNNAGVVNFRNSDNTADVNIKAKKFTFDSSQSIVPSSIGEITYKASSKALYAAASYFYLQGTHSTVEGADCGITMGNYNADAIIKTLDVSTYKWWFGYDKTSVEYTDATCVTTDGDATVTFTHGGNLDTHGIKGSPVTGAGIQANTFISSFDASGNTLELTNVATATADPVTLTFEKIDERFKIHQNIGGSTTAFADTSILNLAKTGALELFGTSASLKLSYNADDYATLSVADTGDLTIATVGDATTDSDLVIDVDGKISMNSAAGDIRVATNAGTYIPGSPSSITTKAYVDGKKVPFVLFSQFQDDISRTYHYLPLAGYFESSVIGGEPMGFIAPFNMTLQKVVVRCSQDISGANTKIGMWAIDSGTTHTHHVTTGMNWAEATGGAADTNAVIDFTGTLGLAGSGTGGSNAVTAGQWVDFSILNSTDQTTSAAEFWVTIYFLADMDNTV